MGWRLSREEGESASGLFLRTAAWRGLKGLGALRVGRTNFAVPFARPVLPIPDDQAVAHPWGSLMCVCQLLESLSMACRFLEAGALRQGLHQARPCSLAGGEDVADVLGVCAWLGWGRGGRRTCCAHRGRTSEAVQ